MDSPTNPIIAAGPVIIENGMVLLNRERLKSGLEKDDFMFPGGGLEGNETPEEACRREAREELGIGIEIIKALRTIRAPHTYKNCDVILHHFFSKRIGEVTPGEETIEWGWYDIHDLPKNCASNVKKIMKQCIEEKLI